MYRKEHGMYRVQYYSRFQALTGGLGTYTLWIKGGATVPCFTLKASFLWFLEPHIRLLPKMFSDLP